MTGMAATSLRDAAQDAAPAALRAFFRIADRWRLTNDEARILLGRPPASTFYRWKAGHAGALSGDVVERLSYVLGIYKALQLLLPDPDAADAWVRRPNDGTPFGGRPALARMLSGNVADLFIVREYLDSERGG